MKNEQSIFNLDHLPVKHHLNIENQKGSKHKQGASQNIKESFTQ
jgi:hypothetical protein